MDTIRTLARILLAAVFGLMTVSAQAVEERELIQTLQSDASPADKALACKQLSIYGSPAAVPELAKLLTDEHLASWSRIALEAIPDAAAGDALRSALPTLRGKLLVGAINSIGVRRDAGSVEPLIAQLKAQDAEVASAAAVALGQIGGAPATQALRQSLAGAPATVRPAIAEGCVLCAERLMADGKAADAVAVYDELRKADLPKQSILEATRGAILARKSEGIALLVDQLRSQDKTFFQLGLGTARELREPDVAKALLAEIVGATPDRAALMLYVLADRRDPGVLPAVLEAATSGDKQVRIAAINILPRLGDATCVATLLKIAGGGDAELSTASKAALAGLPGEKVDGEIRARLAGADTQSLPLLFELVGLRRIDAKADLLKGVDNPQPAVRSAAWTALGATVGLNDLSLLVGEVTAPKHPDDTKLVEQSLRAACVRMPEREACADQLAVAMAGAPIATQCTLLGILGSMGGEKALATIGAAAKGGDESLQDAATRSLGEWMNTDAAPVLLDLAKTLTTDKYKVRAMRGYIRLARQFAANDRERVEMCQNAMAAAARNDERKLVLDILSRIPNLNALRMTVKAAENPELKADATKAAQAIYDKMPTKTPEASALVAKLASK